MTDIILRKEGGRRSGRRVLWLAGLLLAVAAATVYIVATRSAPTSGASGGASPGPEAAGSPPPAPAPSSAVRAIAALAPAAPAPAAAPAPVAVTSAVVSLPAPPPPMPPVAAPAARPAPPAAPVRAGDEAAVLFAEAQKLKEQDKLDLAREKGLEALAKAPDEAARQAVRDFLGPVGIALATTLRAMPEKKDYIVEAGDSLKKIAAKFGTTVDLIQLSHRHASATIRPGERFRILEGRFAIAVDKSDNYLDLTLDGRFFKRYRVGTGQYNWTPTGTNKIVDRITEPAWYRPDGKVIPYGDPENLLGTHWLKLDIPGFGIHGTWEPDTIGKQSSAGCVRMLNDDVKELFTLVPVGTPVAIQD